jgi:hypothetical protein
MISEAKQVRLGAFLAQLPGPVAARVAKAVEIDRLTGSGLLPHDSILTALRPKLRGAVPARTPTPQRFFCRPFEDLLIDRPRKEKQKGRIARSSIQPVWDWLAETGLSETHETLTHAIRAALLKADEEDVQRQVEALWTASAEVLHEATAGENDKKTLGRALGDRLVAEDAAEMAVLLSEGAEIAALQALLPRPLVTLGEADIQHLREAYDRFNETNRDIAAYVPLIVMGRLERPWEALRLAAVVSRRATDTLMSATDLGIAGELLFQDMEEHMQIISAARPVDFDPEHLLHHLGTFAELSSGMVKELAMRRDGKWGQRLTKARGQVAQTMESLLEKAPREIAGALAPLKMGGFGKSPKPIDVMHSPDPDKVARAKRYAHLIAHCRPFASASAFNAKLKEVADDVANTLRLYAEDLLREARARPGPGPIAEHQDVLLDLAVPLLGEEETGLLRRRIRAAA